MVTGGAGFLGSHLCDRLIERGEDLLCVDNFFTASKRNVSHLSGNPDFELMRHDVTLPLIVEVDRILQASTSEVYGDPEVHPQPESYWVGSIRWVFAVVMAKSIPELKPCFFDYFCQHALEIKVMRIFSTYGNPGCEAQGIGPPPSESWEHRQINYFFTFGIKKLPFHTKLDLTRSS